MSADLLLVYENGYAEAREPSLRDRFEVERDVAEDMIKSRIEALLDKANTRRGHVLVKWHDKMYVCEKRLSGRGYTKQTISYHPCACELV